jgi:hypothetical protein
LAVVGATDGQLLERTSPGGDENQTTVRKPSRPKAAVDPGKAVERAAKVGLPISINITLFMILYRRKNG